MKRIRLQHCKPTQIPKMHDWEGLMQKAQDASQKGTDVYYLFCHNMHKLDFYKMKADGYHKNFREAALGFDREKKNV